MRMTREEILAVAKPALFNTEMVRAILDGRKTVTRRLVKPQHLRVLDSQYHQEHPEVPDNVLIEKLCEPPYKPGDYLYVRETWSPVYPDDTSNDVVGYMFRADDGMGVAEYDRRYPNGKDYYWTGIWCPSIHMPKEAARIFIRVKDVRVERLQEIDNVGALKEGCDGRCSEPADGALSDCQMDYDFSIEKFMTVWDSTIKPKDRDRYGWAANPWVWVTEFEKMKVD